MVNMEGFEKQSSLFYEKLSEQKVNIRLPFYTNASIKQPVLKTTITA